MNCLYCNESVFISQCPSCHTPLCKVCHCKDICDACEDCSAKTLVAKSYSLISLCEKCFTNRMKNLNNSICFLKWPGGDIEEIGMIPMKISMITNQIVPKINIYVSPENREGLSIEPIGISMEESLIDDIKEKKVTGKELIIIAANTLSRDILKDLCQLVIETRLNIVWFKPVFNEMHAIVPESTRKAKPKDLIRVVDEYNSEGFPLCMKSKIIQKFSSENLRYDLNELLKITKNQNLIKVFRFSNEFGQELILASRKIPVINIKVIEMAIKFYENAKLFPFLFRIQELLMRLYEIEASLNVIETFIFMIPGYGISSENYRSTQQISAKTQNDIRFKTVFKGSHISSQHQSKYDEFLSFLDTMKNYRTSRGILVWSIAFKHFYGRTKPKLSIGEVYEFFEYGLQNGDITIQNKKILKTVKSEEISPIIYSFPKVCSADIKVPIDHPITKPPSPQKLIPPNRIPSPKADFVTPQECINMVIGILLEYKDGLEISSLYSIVESLFAPRVLDWEHLEYNDFEDLLNCIKDIDVSDNFAIYHSYKKSEECPYCMDDLSDDDTKLECSHQFHKTCLMEIVNKTKNMNQTEINCPMCRAKISQRMINIILGPAPPKKKVAIKQPRKSMPLPQPKKQASNHGEWLIPGVMKCLNNRCEYWFDAGNAKKYKCPLCNIEYCLQCLLDLYHCVCKTHQTEEDEEFIKWMKSNNIKPCPACGMAVSNETNQASVNCIACNATFCFQCGQVKDRCIC
ncbi:unnamed protein product [Blepharisma stoltei]|uniref:RING-type domain-containing protein n=1 Tax=Blepharisma stoltei TaxID=1481888 RepID=A0AAU9JZE3_9CILI|nr:unnamed protein product [Blepharisma stoltei]